MDIAVFVTLICTGLNIITAMMDSCVWYQTRVSEWLPVQRLHATVLVCPDVLWPRAWFGSTVPPCCLLLFICGSEINCFYTSRNRNLCFFVCVNVLFHCLCCSLNCLDHVSISPHWCSNKAVFNCARGARIVLITRKAQTSERRNIIGTPRRILSAQYQC